MLRIEAVIFASTEPVPREKLARVVGKDCSIDLLIDDLQEELRDRPYELVPVAGGWQHRTRSRFTGAIRAASAPTRSPAAALSDSEAMVLMTVGYFQPVTRGELSKIFGKEVSRNTVGALRSAGFPPPARAARRRGHPTPMSRRSSSSPPSAWRPCATYRTSKHSRMRDCCQRKGCLRATLRQSWQAAGLRTSEEPQHSGLARWREVTRAEVRVPVNDVGFLPYLSRLASLSPGHRSRRRSRRF